MSRNSRGFPVATFAYNADWDPSSITDETVNNHIETHLYLTTHHFIGSVTLAILEGQKQCLLELKL